MSLEDNSANQGDATKPEETGPQHAVAQRAIDEPPQEQKKHRRRGLLLIILAVLLIGGGVGVGVWQFWPANAHGIRDMEGNIIVPDDPTATSSEFMQAADMVADDGGQGFTVPTLNIQVPLGSINAVNGVMDPPNFTSVFWVRNFGVPLDQASTGTVYLVTHAVQGGKAPGNMLQQNDQVLLKPGDVIKVNDLTYQFDSSQIIAKTDLANHADLWTNTAGRLILVTCELNPKGGLAVNNMVIIAHLVP